MKFKDFHQRKYIWKCHLQNVLHFVSVSTVTHISVDNLTIIGSDNGLLAGQHQAIIWTNAGILLTGPLGTNLSEILIEFLNSSIQEYSFGNGGHFVSASVC